MNDVQAKKDYYRAWMEKVQAENDAFEAASEGEKRVIIAKDVLAHLNGGVLAPAHKYGSFIVDCRPEGSLRDAIVDEGISCVACARGGIVFSTIMRRNRVKGPRMCGSSMVAEFTKRMMRDIEAAFECCAGISWEPESLPSGLMNIWMRASERYCRAYHIELDRFRLEAIMNWIIDHEGEFSLVDFLNEKVDLLKEQSNKKP